MPMYSWLEYSDNYADSSGSVWQFKRDEQNITNFFLMPLFKELIDSLFFVLMILLMILKEFKETVIETTSFQE